MRPWTCEELQYLEDKWGTVSIPGIAKKVGRSVSAVKNKVQKLNLGPHLLGGDKVSANALQIAITGRHGGDYTVRRWIRAGLPTHLHKVQDLYVRTVDIAEFWRWAEAHKGVISFAHFEEGTLGVEPTWAKEKRRIDQRERRKKIPWTREEDATLEGMLAQRRYTYIDLAATLNRSQASIKSRIYDIGLDIQPIRSGNKPWTASQEALLLQMYADGRSWDAIGQILGRSGAATRARYELIESRRRTTPCNTTSS